MNYSTRNLHKKHRLSTCHNMDSVPQHYKKVKKPRVPWNCIVMPGFVFRVYRLVFWVSGLCWGRLDLFRGVWTCTSVVWTCILDVWTCFTYRSVCLYIIFMCAKSIEQMGCLNKTLSKLIHDPGIRTLFTNTCSRAVFTNTIQTRRSQTSEHCSS